MDSSQTNINYFLVNIFITYRCHSHHTRDIRTFNKPLKFQYCLLKEYDILVLVSLEVTNSTTVWSLQPRLPLILTSLMSFYALMGNRSSNTSPLVSLSNTWMRNMSSMGSRSLTYFLLPDIWLFQQISG